MPLPTRQPRRRSALLGILALATALAYEPTKAQETGSADACERFAHVALPATKITEARVVAPGTFSGPPAPFTGRDMSPLYRSLPAFCRVSATATPTSDSEIKIEVWMPVSGWSGKLQGLGNGGFAGLIDYPNLGVAMGKGYAAAATDTGHTGNSASFALGHPEKLIDYAYRSEHAMAVAAKAVVGTFYGKMPSRSYFNGCSTGGRQALVEASRYPDDFDAPLPDAVLSQFGVRRAK